MFRLLAALFALALSCAAADCSPPQRGCFYVSLSGNDNWTGQFPDPNSDGTGPFATIPHAQAAVSTLRNSWNGNPITVMLRGGTYYLSSTLTFSTYQDFGTSTGPITWTNYPGETPIISGGIPVGTGTWGQTWTRVNNTSLYKTPVPAGMANFEFLYYNGERRLRPRLASTSGLGYYMLNGTCTYSPNQQAAPIGSCNLGTFFRVASEITPTSQNPCPSVTNAADSKMAKCLDRFRYDPGDLPSTTWVNLNPAGSACKPSNSNSPPSAYPTGDVELILFDAWTVDILRVSCVDPNQHIIYFTGSAQGNAGVYNHFGPTKGHRYIVENVRDAFDAEVNADATGAPGQTGIWFLDRSTSPNWTLNYLANPGESPSTDTVVIPQLQANPPAGGSLLNATGINYVTFSGITFEMDAWTVPSTGFNTDENGASTVPVAVDCEGCQHVTFDGITIRHTAASGIQIATPPGTTSPAAVNDVIQNSAFYDIGSSGIHIGHHPQTTDQLALVVGSVTVSNNIVQGYSRVFPSGEGIAQGNGHDITYSHNDVTDGYHAGISICLIGCPSSGFSANGINIFTEYNHIWNVMQGITSDGGALYYNVGTPGGSGIGNHMRNNLIHDVTDAGVIDRIPGKPVIPGTGYGGSGIYIDNHSAGIDVANNVVFRVSGPAVHITNAPPPNLPAAYPFVGHTFRNNIFAMSPSGMFEQQQPWDQGCNSTTRTLPLVTFTNNFFYFDTSPGFYVMRGCAYSCGISPYSNFQNFLGNLYWRTDGKLTNAVAFHILTNPPAPANASSCSDPGDPQRAWTFMTFGQWQNSVAVGKNQVNMNEDAGGTIADPGFGSAAAPGDFTLQTSPISGFDFKRTNDTIQKAGRSTPTIQVAPVPHTFPTFYLANF